MKKILIHAIPNSRANDVRVIADNILKVKIAAPPIDGKANKELIKVLAKHFKIHKSEVIILKGDTTDKKVIAIPD
jgi:uncharacterized protein (TIGR00251 family)